MPEANFTPTWGPNSNKSPKNQYLDQHQMAGETAQCSTRGGCFHTASMEKNMHTIKSRNASISLKIGSSSGDLNDPGSVPGPPAKGRARTTARKIIDARTTATELNRLECDVAEKRKELAALSGEIRSKTATLASARAATAEIKAALAELVSALPGDELIGKVDAAFMAMNKHLLRASKMAASVSRAQVSKSADA